MPTWSASGEGQKGRAEWANAALHLTPGTGIWHLKVFACITLIWKHKQFKEENKQTKQKKSQCRSKIREHWSLAWSEDLSLKERSHEDPVSARQKRCPSRTHVSQAWVLLGNKLGTGTPGAPLTFRPIQRLTEGLVQVFPPWQLSASA